MDFHHNPWYNNGMSQYARALNLPNLLKNKSFFLFGPRATGKSSLVSVQLPKCVVFDLLDGETYKRLLSNPRIIEEVVRTNEPNSIVVIDEVQKLPSLLDEVHRIISKHSVRFLLTGSSARKLRRGGANLLAGRAWQAELFPLCTREVPEFDLITYLNTGGLPVVYGSSFASEELRSYVGTYLKEEIQAESLTRNLPAFSSFLDAIALSNGQEINMESLASDCGVSPTTLKNYLGILDSRLRKQDIVVGEVAILNEEIDRVGQIVHGLAELEPESASAQAEVGRVVRIGRAHV